MVVVNLGNTLYYHTPSRRNGGAASGSIIAKGISAIFASSRIAIAAGSSTASCCNCRRSTLNVTGSSIIPIDRIVVATSVSVVFVTGT